MEINTVKKFFMLTTIVFFTNSLNAKDTKISYPKDTLQAFIKNYGKDSLIHLLNNKIDTAFQWLKAHDDSKDWTMATNKVEFKLYSKYFELTNDTSFLKIDTIEYKDNYSLYGYYVRKVSMDAERISNWKSVPSDTLKKYILAEIHNPNTRLGLPLYGRYFTMPDSIYFLYSNYALKADLGNQMITYISLASYQKNINAQNSTILNEVKFKIFTQMYKVNNLEEVITKPTLTSPSNEEIQNKVFDISLQTLAYGLYGKDVNLLEHGRDLMYLLALQNEDGGFRNPVNNNKYSLGNSSIYALWSLCEFRAQLTQYKPIKK